MKAKTREFIEMTLRRLKPLKQASFWYQDQLNPSPEAMAVKLHSELLPLPLLLCSLLLLPSLLLPVLLPSFVAGDGIWWWSGDGRCYWRWRLRRTEAVAAAIARRRSRRRRRRKRKKKEEMAEAGGGWWLRGGSAWGGEEIAEREGREWLKTWRR